MLVAAFTWGDLWRLALAVFLLAVGLASAYLLARLGSESRKRFVEALVREELTLAANPLQERAEPGGRLEIGTSGERPRPLVASSLILPGPTASVVERSIRRVSFAMCRR